jgi:hypothetical protein
MRSYSIAAVHDLRRKNHPVIGERRRTNANEAERETTQEPQPTAPSPQTVPCRHGRRLILAALVWFRRATVCPQREERNTGLVSDTIESGVVAVAIGRRTSARTQRE